MAASYDLVVIGTGAGAAGVAVRGPKAGLKTAIIDERPYGGTCPLRGCEPKKTLVVAAMTVEDARRHHERGVEGEPRINWPELMAFKRTFTDPVPEKREASFKKKGIENLHGHVRFTGPNTLMVDDQEIEAKYIHIGTGSRPADLPIDGAELLMTSDDFLEMEKVPRHILFVGGGYIGLEFAFVMRAAGADVTILEMMERPLTNFDPDLVSLLMESVRCHGLDLHVGTRVTGIEKIDGGLRVHADANGEHKTFETEVAIHGAHRVPNVEHLDLEKANVAYDNKGITVNKYMQSVSNPAVYAAGDVVENAPMLSPVASFEARVAAMNILKGNHEEMNYPPIPSVTWTFPPLAAVGLLEDQAKEQGLKFRTNFDRTTHWNSSRREAEECAGYKILIEEETNRFIGAHILGHNAEEVINLVTVAMRHDIRSDQLKNMIFTYPTRGSDLQRML